MAQSAEDVARASIESYNAGDFDRLRSLLADDFYEEELATQRRLDGQMLGSRQRGTGSKRFRTSTARSPGQIGAMDPAEIPVASRLHSAARSR